MDATEHFQSSEAISAGKCGHVFHEACIARWLGESGGHCPQCRTLINKCGLTRLFFTQSSAKSTSTINELQTRIAQLIAECRRKEDSILALHLDSGRQKATIELFTDKCRRIEATIKELKADCRHKHRLTMAIDAECRQKMGRIEELTLECRRKACTIDELTAARQQKDDTIEELRRASELKDVCIATLTKTNHERADLIVDQAALLNQLTKELK